MRFTITHRIENDLPLAVLLDKATGIEVSVIPSFGAILHSFTIQIPGGSFNIIDNYKSLQELKNTLSTSHKSSKLSPFVCRIKEGKYRFDEKEFEFLRKFPDGSAIHGLIFDKAFEVTDEVATETSASVTMQYHYKKADAGYPFHYDCQVRYELKKEGLLQIETTVINTGGGSIPISDGWHPYFIMGGKTDEWELSFRAARMVEFDDRLIPTGRIVPNTRFAKPEKIRDTFLDNCFLLDDLHAEPACTLQNPQNGWQLLFFPGKHYPYLQIYTPPHRKSIAIENLSGAPDCFNNGMGLTILEPGRSQTFSVGYQILVSEM